MTDPACTVNTSATTNGVNVTGGATVTIQLASLSGVSSWLIECVGTDDGQVAATITASLSINTSTKTATFTAPSSATALIFRSQVNQGQDINGNDVDEYTTTFGVYVLTSAGGRLGATNETTEGSAAYGWITKLNTLLRGNGLGDQQGLRLTLTTALPVTTSDVTGAATLYFTPHTSGMISLYYSSAWLLVTTAEVSLSLASLTSGKNYDVFAAWSGSAVTLSLSAAWTDDTTRADALTTQNGVTVKSGDATKRWIGTLRASGSGTCEDSNAKRYLWNARNKAQRKLKVIEATDSWTGNGSVTWGATNASSANKFEMVCGSAEYVEAVAQLNVASAAISPGVTGIGIDSTTVNSADTWSYPGYDTAESQTWANYRGHVAAGYHAFQWLELSAHISVTFYGDWGTTIRQSAMIGTVWA